MHARTLVPTISLALAVQALPALAAPLTTPVKLVARADGATADGIHRDRSGDDRGPVRGHEIGGNGIVPACATRPATSGVGRHVVIRAHRCVSDDAWRRYGSGSSIGAEGSRTGIMTFAVISSTISPCWFRTRVRARVSPIPGRLLLRRFERVTDSHRRSPAGHGSPGDQ